MTPRKTGGSAKLSDMLALHPSKIEGPLKSIQEFHQDREQVNAGTDLHFKNGKRFNFLIAGDYVSVIVKGVNNKRAVLQKYSYLTKVDRPCNCTVAFRATIAMLKPDQFALHQTYKVYYGASRKSCVVLWIAPEDGKTASGSSRKCTIEPTRPQKPKRGPKSTRQERLKVYREELKKAKEMDVQKQKELGKDFKRPPRPQWKRATAILMPLIQFDIAPYQPSEFEKNYRGKVMLTAKNEVVGAGRVDRAISVSAPTFSGTISRLKSSHFLHAICLDGWTNTVIFAGKPYGEVKKQAASLFTLPAEQNLLEQFLKEIK